MTFPSNITQGVPKQYQGNLTWVPNSSYQGGGYWAAYKRGVHYSYAQLERLILDANPNASPDEYAGLANIAENSESGGNTGEWNSSGATGLWQIEWPSNYGGKRQTLFEPLTNAQTADKLFKSQGFSPWGSDPHGNLNVPPAKSVPNIKANKGGTSSSVSSTGNVSTTSLISGLGNINNFFSLLTSADIWERVGLVLLGTIMVIIGILILVAPSANEKIGEALGIVTKTKRLGGELGISGGDSGPSPEVKADKERRLALAERNATIGERKASVMEAKEGRLSLGKPATKKHKSGNPEPNPAPTHS